MAYLENVKPRRSADSEGVVIDLPLKKCSRPLLLGDLDEKVQQYLKKVREGGGIVSAVIVIAAPREIVTLCDCSMLAEFGGYVELGRSWAYGLLDQMKFV